MSRALVAVAWPYASGPRHVGHVAGFGVPSDVYARYRRLVGDDVLMVSGTDEHGTPILVRADAEGVPPRALADRYNRQIAEDLVGLGLSYDLFTRTSTRNHADVVREVFRTLRANGYLREETVLGARSPSTGRTLPDRYIEGTCPICGYGAARGDQCDSCGNQLDPADLVDPRSTINGEIPEFARSEHVFLDLPRFAGALQEWLVSRTGWRPNVLQFSLNLVEELKPRAITRDIDWGVPVPGWEDRDDKRIYVWFDAVIGYLSASVEWARRRGEPDAWRAFWDPAGTDVDAQYFMGKDNVVFHTVIWPALLLGCSGHGDLGGEPGPRGELRLPDEVVSSEFLTMEGRKFSSSRSVVIAVRDVLERYGPDPLRYYLAVAGPERSDTDFTWAEFVRRTNDELVAAWGNLVNRSVSFTAKRVGSVPPLEELTDADEALLAAVRAGFATVGAHFARSEVKAATSEAVRVVSEVNKYFSDMAPWALAKTDEARMRVVLAVTLQAVRDCATLLAPVLPHSSNAVHRMLGGTRDLTAMPRLEEVHDMDDGTPYPVITGDYGDADGRWESAPLVAGTPLDVPTVLFRKLDPSVVDEELARLAG